MVTVMLCYAVFCSDSAASLSVVQGGRLRSRAEVAKEHEGT